MLSEGPLAPERPRMKLLVGGVGVALLLGAGFWVLGSGTQPGDLQLARLLTFAAEQFRRGPLAAEKPAQLRDAHAGLLHEHLQRSRRRDAKS